MSELFDREAIYKAIEGIDTGLHCATILAHVYLDGYDKHILHSVAPMVENAELHRYIDDGLLILQLSDYSIDAPLLCSILSATSTNIANSTIATIIKAAREPYREEMKAALKSASGVFEAEAAPVYEKLLSDKHGAMLCGQH